MTLRHLYRFWRRLLRLARRQLAARRRSGCVGSPGRLFVPRSVSVVVLDRHGDRYVFVWDDQHETDIMRTAGRFAIDERLNFTWRDAGIVAECIGKLNKELQ